MRHDIGLEGQRYVHYYKCFQVRMHYDLGSLTFLTDWQAEKSSVEKHNEEWKNLFLLKLVNSEGYSSAMQPNLRICFVQFREYESFS